MESLKTYVRERGELPTRAGLDALLERYPWFATARVLRSVAMKAPAESISDPLLALSLVSKPLPAPWLRPEVESAQPVVAQDAQDAQTAQTGGAAEVEGSHTTQESLIERFLTLGDYRIVPAADASQPLDESQQDEPQGVMPQIVTEGLAQIYMRQQLWSQAREAYEKLSLLYPEKSVYFAEIIADIEHKATQMQTN